MTPALRSGQFVVAIKDQSFLPCGAQAGWFDNIGCMILPLDVKFTEAKTHFVAAFRRNPKTAAPKVRMTTVADFHDWKAEMRAYDAAKMDLNLATPQQIQAKNAAIHVPRGGARIVRHAQYV